MFELKRSDLREGELYLKIKHGLYYRPNNSGYTSVILFAGWYTKDEVSECFDENGKNGNYNIFCQKLEDEASYYTEERIEELKEKLEILKEVRSKCLNS